MEFGVPKESRPDEFRVGLTPAGIELLAAQVTPALWKHDAGRGAGFSDVDYEEAGARIVYSAQELYGRSGVVVKVGRPTAEEVEWLRDGCVILGFLPPGGFAARARAELARQESDRNCLRDDSYR